MNETLEQDDAVVRIEKLKQNARKVISDIDKFDIMKNSAAQLIDLFEELDCLKERVEDELDILAVEDFLLNGAGHKNKNI